MYEKALIVIIFMYSTSFMFLAAQYLIGDVFGMTLTNFDGDEIQSNVLTIIDVDEFNSQTGTVLTSNQTTISTDPIIAAAGMALEFFQLLTGTYVFNLMFFFGIPSIVVAGFSGLYALLMIRAVIAILRGI